MDSNPKSMVDQEKHSSAPDGAQEMQIEVAKQVPTQIELDDQTSVKPKYRDSIENRYLFPCDDPIDSTLEADLDTLSQARYGNKPFGGVGRRQASSSRGTFFRSLRSLLSCIVISDRSSQLDEGPYEENYGGDASFQIVESSQPNSLHNKSADFYSRTDSSIGQEAQFHGRYFGLHQQEIDQNFICIQSQKNTKEDERDTSKLSSNGHTGDSGDCLMHQRGLMAKREQGSECQQDFGSIEASKSNASYSIEYLRNRFSSLSSDCGFSSASQNSVNQFGNFPILPYSPLKEPDKSRANGQEEISKRTCTGQIHSVNKSQTKIEEAVHGLGNCCLHPRTGDQSQLSRDKDLAGMRGNNKKAEDCSAGPKVENSKISLTFDGAKQDIQAQSDLVPGGLPQCFELKLTLSINRNDKEVFDQKSGRERDGGTNSVGSMGSGASGSNET